ncbi:MAG: hypothetical protein R3F62_09625 [Planctomycetota bacterium]
MSVGTPARTGLQGLSGALCRGDVAALEPWVARPSVPAYGLCLLALALGGAVFGGALGAWRSPLQAAFAATKLPLLFVLTAACTGALNGMLAKLYGVPLTLAQSVLSVLSSFALVGLVLGSLAPPLLLLVGSLPGPESTGARSAHRTILLGGVGLIGCAGVLANVRLYALLRRFEVARGQARRTLASWLAVNLFVGAQLSWNLRPFFGSPHMREQFLRDDPFDGTFYEAVYASFRSLVLGT